MSLTQPLFKKINVATGDTFSSINVVARVSPSVFLVLYKWKFCFSKLLLLYPLTLVVYYKCLHDDCIYFIRNHVLHLWKIRILLRCICVTIDGII